ncbi:Collagen alpha-1(XXVI) chain [Tupaia chinensis]|uniref:Collagen alpha-1(XXVI) chain n=1 Tax=Tupaia chinensis TaxID=246437 RepID=L9K4V1_TUPCH|nr:Collagen alpha-1(XXVI) chain [Tupaia chinensis]
MKLALLLPWACCCLCGSALATGFLYPFPAAPLHRGRQAARIGGRGPRSSSRSALDAYWPAGSSRHAVPGPGTWLDVEPRQSPSCVLSGPCSYRTLIRPTYRVSYRTVTALEWRCCPGFTGSNCDEAGIYPGGHRSKTTCEEDMGQSFPGFPPSNQSSEYEMNGDEVTQLTRVTHSVVGRCVSAMQACTVHAEDTVLCSPYMCGHVAKTLSLMLQENGPQESTEQL